MKGARINFGVPNSEYVLLANDNGEATSLKNQDTGTEYIGGGGGGDFSTAEVTIVDNTEGNHQVYDCPICVEENAVGDGSPACIISAFRLNSGNYIVPLYKGISVWREFYNLFEGITIELDGDISQFGLNNIIITGNGTITLS